MTFFIHFFDLFIESAPWLLLGFIIAGLIKTLIPEDFLTRHLGGPGLWTTIKAAIIGAPLPLCSCGVVPAAMGLRKAGASKNATVSFLIATPETGVDSVSVTYALMGPIMAIVRPIAAVVSAVFAGVLVGRSEPPDNKSVSTNGACCSSSDAEQKDTESSCCASSGSCCSTVQESDRLIKKIYSGMRFAFEDLIDDIALWLLVGLLFAAAILTWVPTTFLTQWGSSWMAFLIMALVGVPMYICATASTPIAAGLLLAGISPGAVLVFMLTGPATNIGTMLIIRNELGLRALVSYLIGVVLTSFAFGYMLNQLIQNTSLAIDPQSIINSSAEGLWLAYASALLLLFLMVKSFSKTLLSKRDTT